MLAGATEREHADGYARRDRTGIVHTGAGVQVEGIEMLRTGTLSRGGVSRRSILVGTAGVAGVVSAACEPGSGGSPANTTAPVTMEIWHPWDATREPFFKQVVADYQKLHPNVTINAALTHL